MVYGPKFSETEFVGGKNILASEHQENVKGGATLDATKFATGYVELGQLVVRNTTTGKFEPYADEPGELEAPATFPTGYDTPAVLNVDFNNDGKTDVIAGEVMVRCSVYEAKLPVAPTDAFKAAAPLIQFISHV